MKINKARNSKYRKPFGWLFGWLRGRIGILAATTFGSLLWFVIDWNLDTTFRSMSDWMLYAVNITAALVLLAPAVLTRRAWPQFVLLVALDLLFEANLMYNRTYLTAIPASSYGLASNMADFTTSISGSLKLADIGFVVILIAGAILSARCRVNHARRLVVRWLSLTAVMLAVVVCGLAARGGFYKAYDKLVQSCYYFTCGTPTYTVGGHIIYTLMDARRNASLSDADKAMIDRWLTDHEAYSAPADSIEGRKSLVLIICESLESWPIEGDIDGKAVAPHLRELALDSTTFYAPHVLTQVAAGHSIDAQLLYTAGLLPTINSVYSMKYPSSTYPTVNKALKADRGARSTMLTPDKIFTWNQGTIARSFGYDSIMWRTNWQMDETIQRKLSDGSFLRQSVAELRKGELWPEGEPAMLTFITYTGHFPFKINEDMRDPDFDISGADLPDKIKDYATTTHYVDAQLPTLIDYLKGRADWKDMIVVIVGDHEAMGAERSKLRDYSAASAALVSDGRYTPLIVLNSPVPGRYDAVMGQVDVYTTLLDMLGLHNAWRGMGTSVFSPAKVPVAFSSVPQELVGDTCGVDARTIDHLRIAREVSDKIIIHNMLQGR